MIYPENFEEKIGFDKIRVLLKDHAISVMGQEKVDFIHFSTSHECIHRDLKQVDEFKTICLHEDHFPADHYFDLRKALNTLKAEGTYPDIEEMVQLRQSLSAIKAIKAFFTKKEPEQFPYLKKLIRRIVVHDFVKDRINRILNNQGHIKDNASPALKNIRISLYEKQNNVSSRINKLFKEAQKDGIVTPEAQLTIRNGRTVIPVYSKQKRKIKGYIHDESATGQTTYIEPSEIVELNNEIRELKFAENREITRILIAFADDIRPYIPELHENYNILGDIDLIRAKALFALRIGAHLPDINQSLDMQWKKAIHPLLFLTNKKEQKKTVPLDFQLNAQNRILLISGPNAGGKSVCLKTVGLLQYMFQSGLLIPVRQGSKCCVFQEIFLNIGDDQSLENDLSTYSSHLLHMKNFIEHASGHTLALVDELGAGTEPRIGGAIAESILEELNEKKAYGVMTTHYSNLKHFATNTDGINNAAMLFDTVKLMPRYILETGIPGSSFAFEIASKTGLDKHMLNKAKEKAGKEHVDFDKNLKEITQSKQYFEQKTREISAKENKLKSLLNQYERELKNTKQLRREVLDKANAKADQILSGINQKIENTIRQIKENNAEKESTKKIRKEFDDHIRQSTGDIYEQDHLLNSKFRRLNTQLEQNIKPHNKSQAEQPVVSGEIAKGDPVKIKGQASAGRVLHIHKTTAKVEMGNLVTEIQKKKLEKISEQEYTRLTKSLPGKTKTNIVTQQAKTEFRQEIDIRGKRADEALQIVKNHIDSAIVHHVENLRIIHGKGNGILRQVIRNYLQSEELVSSFKDEDIRTGGTGATIIEMDV
jgi:DNA mismatch repair protein MutS2